MAQRRYLEVVRHFLPLHDGLKTIDYVAVRALTPTASARGWSSPEWTEASRLPDHGWLNTVQSSQSSGGASIASANAQNQLAAPSWGTITRGDDTARRSGADRRELDGR